MAICRVSKKLTLGLNVFHAPSQENPSRKYLSQPFSRKENFPCNVRCDGYATRTMRLVGKIADDSVEIRWIAAEYSLACLGVRMPATARRQNESDVEARLSTISQTLADEMRLSYARG